MAASQNHWQQLAIALDGLLNNTSAICLMSWIITFTYLKVGTAAPWVVAFVLSLPLATGVGFALMLLLWLGIGLCALAQRYQP